MSTTYEPPPPPPPPRPAATSGDKPAPSMWEKTKGYSNTAYSKGLKPGFDKAYNVIDKLGAPVNRLSNKMGAEAFWPTDMGTESEKAARILRGFCKDGFYDQVDANDAKRMETKDQTGVPQTGVPQGKQRVMVKIPTKVIQEAKGLAIFTTMRTGWFLGGSGGAGVIVARHPETGEWSAPSGIQTQNLSFGFLIGVDIYDTVLVIKTYKALEAFTKVRATLGTEVGVAAGPVGAGGAVDTELNRIQAPILSYVKSRGLYAGIALEGNVVIERTDENAKFYGYEVSAQEIFNGKVRPLAIVKEQYQVLMDTLRAAQGDDVDESLLPEPGIAPSDMELDTSDAAPTFGIPAHDEDDPYGVKALEAEGLIIREAGTHQRPSAEVFEFKPSPSSPIYGHSFRKSMDAGSLAKQRTWRDSTASLSSVNRGTQTDDDESPHRKENMSPPVKESQVVTDSEQTHSPERRNSFSDIDSDAEIHTATPVVSRAKVVNVPKRVPPALPPRNPGRVVPSAEGAPSEGFEQISLNGGDERSDEQVKSTDQPSDLDLSTSNVERDPNRLSRATSEGGEDKFQSIPGTPVNEREDEKTKSP